MLAYQCSFYSLRLNIRELLMADTTPRQAQDTVNFLIGVLPDWIHKDLRGLSLGEDFNLYLTLEHSHLRAKAVKEINDTDGLFQLTIKAARRARQIAEEEAAAERSEDLPF